MEQSENSEIVKVYLKDKQDVYLLDKDSIYLTTNEKKENEIMANTKKYVSLDKLSLYDEKIKKYLADADAAVLKSAKDYSDETLTLANNNAASLANTAEANAKAHADGKDAAIQAAHKAGTDAAAAAATADGKAVQAQSEVDALEAYVGTFAHDSAKTVVEYINAKTDGIATSGNLEALAGRVTQAEKDIDAIEADYLKAADKNELAGDIATAQAAAEGAQSYAEGVAGDLAEAVEALEGADEAQVARIAALEGTIVGLSGAMHFEGVVEIDPTKITEGYAQGDVVIYGNKEYVWNNGAFVEFGDASVNAEAITNLTGRVSTAEGKITAAEGKITSLEGAVATKVEKSVYDEKVAELAGADTGLSNRIAALEGKFGGAEGSIEDQIADAQAAAVASAAEDATKKADKALSDAKAYTDTEVGKDRTRLDALESIQHHDHANKAELDLIVSGDKTKWDSAAAKAHEHGNKTVLDGITAENITTWNTVTSKAAQADLTAVGDRVTAIETWHSNFTEVSEAEINALFGTASA